MPVRLVGRASMPAAFWRHRQPYIEAFLFVLILITDNFSEQSMYSKRKLFMIGFFYSK